MTTQDQTNDITGQDGESLTLDLYMVEKNHVGRSQYIGPRALAI